MFPPATAATRSQLRVFGLTSLVVGLVVAGLTLRAAGGSAELWERPSSWLAGLLLANGVAGSLRPGLVAPVYRVAMAVTRPIGFVVAQIVLALLYLVIIVPLGTILRLAGHDPLRRRPPGAWIAVDGSRRDRSRVFRQY